MQNYSVRDVERILRLTRSTVRGLINAGLVAPSRGSRRELRFSFQDLIVLRAARALIDANVPRRRINRSLEELRRNLPETLPLSGLSIRAIGDRVVVRDGNTHWQADDGQYVLGFDVSMQDGAMRLIEREATAAAGPVTPAPEDWLMRGLELESSDRAAAMKAYEHAVELDPTDVAAWTNWGRLLHENGEVRQAESVYRRALTHCGPDSLLMYNLGVVLDDIGEDTHAIEAYQTAVELDPTLADAHYNLARLYESLGKPQHAIRHFGQYRRLISAHS